MTTDSSSEPMQANVVKEKKIKMSTYSSFQRENIIQE